MDLFLGEYITLSQLAEDVRDVLDDAFAASFWVVGEISSLSTSRGHTYLTLVEQQNHVIVAEIRANLWATKAKILDDFAKVTGEKMRAGMEVLICARLRYHIRYGLSLDILSINPLFTLGALARKRRETIERLKTEGLLKRNRAVQMPLVPARIAVISSPTAAGYQDFIHQLAGNSGGFVFKPTLFPAHMQGDKACQSILEALDCIRLQDHRFDVAVLIRGGGSSLDLSCFDEYDLARAIAQFTLPVLTGIGHDKDESVCDMTAHTALKTPTAVAQHLISLIEEFDSQLLDMEIRALRNSGLQLKLESDNLYRIVLQLKTSVSRQVSRRELVLQRASAGLPAGIRGMLQRLDARLDTLYSTLKRDPARLLIDRNRDLKSVIQKLHEDPLKRISLQRVEVEALARTTRAMDPKNVLKRGYSITRYGGKAVHNVLEIKHGSELQTEVYNGLITSQVISVNIQEKEAVSASAEEE